MRTIIGRLRIGFPFIHEWLVSKGRDGVFFTVETAMIMILFSGCRHLPSVDHDRALFPASEAPNYQQLVSVHWLKSLLDFQRLGHPLDRPLTYENDHFVILETSWASLEKATDYRKGHVPGAIHLNTDELENGEPRWRLRDAEALQKVIGNAGITPETTVIVYGKQIIAAARVWWVLKYAGVADVRLLDGGFEAWKAAGYAVEKDIQTPRPKTFEAVVAANLIASTGYVRAHFNTDKVLLGDVRSVGEFLGEKSGYTYLDAKGRIPGAIHLGDADDQSLLYTKRGGFLRAPSEIQTLWQEFGLYPMGEIQPDKELILYCGGGWRSSLAVFYATLLGIENVRNYSDGWSGWSTIYHANAEESGAKPIWRQELTGNPVETGEP